MRRGVALCWLAVAAAAVAVAPSPAVTAPPHVLLILADDLGHSDVGFNGNGAVAAVDPQLRTHTPTLDRLAASGTVLRQHYSCHVCTPTRTALLTGRYPSRFGAQHRTFAPGRPQGIPLNETLLPERLRAVGYRTALVGKWHAGFYTNAMLPTSRGFDHHYGYYTGDENYYNHSLGPCREEARGCLVPDLGFRDPCGRDWHRDGAPLQFEDTGEDSAYVFGRVAAAVVANHSRDHAGSPLFLMLATQTTHAPYEASTQ